MLVNKLSEYDTEFGGKKSFKMNPFLLYWNVYMKSSKHVWI